MASDRKASTTIMIPRTRRKAETVLTGVAVVPEKVNMRVAVRVIPIIKTMGTPTNCQVLPVRFSHTVTARRARPARS